MRAIILAAGRGERMRPLTDHIPKPLLVVGGKSLIVWHLERLAAAGFSEVVINHAHLGGLIEAALGDGSRWGLSIQYSPEEVALETAGGIVQALPLLGDSPFVVVNGDIYLEFDFSSLAHALHHPNLAHLIMVNNPAQHVEGDFFFNEGQLLPTGARKLTFSGVGVYHPKLFKDILLGQAAKLAPILRAVIDRHLVSAEYYAGKWHDVGTPERLADLDQQLSAAGYLC